MYPQYMCILLYVKPIWCNNIPYIYCQLGRGTYNLSICAFCYMWNLCGVMVFQRSIVNWRCEGYMYLQYMCNMVYVEHIWYHSIPYIFCQLGRGIYILSICAFCYMWNLFGVAIFHTSILNWCGGGKDVFSVYMHSAICETYLVYQYSIHLFSIGVGEG